MAFLSKNLFQTGIHINTFTGPFILKEHKRLTFLDCLSCFIIEISMKRYELLDFGHYISGLCSLKSNAQSLIPQLLIGFKFL